MTPLQKQKVDTRVIVETPEGADFQFVIAGAGTRAVAWLIDRLIQAGILALVSILTLFLLPFGEAGAGLGFGGVALMYLAYLNCVQQGGAALAGQRYGQLDEGQGKTFLSSYARTLTNGQLRFHTDRCDAVGLLCVRQAKAGGVSKLASSAMVHNVMLERRPELCAALYEDIWRSRFGEEPGGEKLAYPLPIFGQRDGRFTSHYSLTYIEAAQKMGEVPRLTEVQRQGIDMLMELAQELSFEMRFEPGDMQLLNNHVIYHGRTPFEDDAASGQDRLLLRIWLALPNSRALPKGHEVLWRSIEPGADRGGIGQAAA